MANHTFEALQEGMSFEQSYTITEKVYSGFLSTFADTNPLHVDEAYAKEKGFKGRVMHGAILSGFLSHFIGMHVPGDRSMLLSSDIRFLKPNYLGDEIVLLAKISQKAETGSLLILQFVFFNKTQNIAVARAQVHVKVFTA
jgi:3-hydroxybutyryl-CoA dehydratase